LFNSPGAKDQKLKTAFIIQDYDEDGLISKIDLKQYLTSISTNALSEEAIEKLVDRVFEESSSHDNQEYLSLADFQRVVAPTDFHVKLRLPI
jgi:Ca2+-binding EF-hand superfamily protein